MARVSRAAIGVALLASGWARPAAAQNTDESVDAGSEEARALFDSAVEEVRRGRFPSARDQFRRSLALLPTASTAFNLALALNGTGETVEAVSVLSALLEGEYGELASEERTQVEELLRRARADLAHLHVSVRGPDRARIRVDGEEVGQASASTPLAVTLDAGRHVIDARARGYQPAESVVQLGRGAAGEATLRLEPAPTPASPRSAEDDSTLWESPVTWIVLGVVVLGGAAAVYLLTRDRTADPVSDPVFGTAEVLRF